VLLKQRQRREDWPIEIHRPSTRHSIAILGMFKIFIEKTQASFCAQLHLIKIWAGKVSHINKLISWTCKERRTKVQILKYILLK